MLREWTEYAASSTIIPYIRAHLGAVFLKGSLLIRENRKSTLQTLGKKMGWGYLPYYSSTC